MSAPPGQRHAFVARTEAELFELEPGALLRYIGAAKRAQRLDEARTAMHMMLFREEERMRSRVRLHLPRHLQHHAETVADWVMERVMRSALKLTLRGESVGEWANWTKAAIELQVISFWRSTEGQTLERESPSPERERAAGFDEERVAERLDAEAAVALALSQLTNPQHRAIVQGAFWADRTSADLASEHATSVANVDQIKSRFRKDLRALLEGGA